MNLKHLILASNFSTRYAIRSGTGIVFVLLTFYLGLTFGGFALLPLEFSEMFAAQRGATNKDFDEMWLVDEIVNGAKEPAIYFLGGGKASTESTDEEDRAWRKADDWRHYMFKQKPTILTFALVLLIYLMPLFISVGCFNTISGDVQHFALRYQLFRTTRASIYFGRYLGIVLFSAAAMLLLVAVELIYVGFRLDHIYEWSELIPWGLRGALALVMLTFPYAAICHMVSSWIDSPFGSLIVAKGVIFVPPTVSVFGWLAWKPFIKSIHVLPWGIHHYFFHPEVKWVLMACGACAGYTVIFLALGYWRFARRDL